MGEPASVETQSRLLAIAETDKDVETAHGIVTVHIGPSQIVAALIIEFADEMTAPHIEACIDRVEKRVADEIPEITALFVKPQTRGDLSSGASLAAKAARVR